MFLKDQPFSKMAPPHCQILDPPLDLTNNFTKLWQWGRSRTRYNPEQSWS